MKIVLYILAAIGAWQVLLWLVWPLVDAFLFACGRLLLDLLNLKWSNIPAHKILFLRLVFSHFFRAFGSRLFDWFETTEVSQGKWQWKPYFHYQKNE